MFSFKKLLAAIFNSSPAEELGAIVKELNDLVKKFEYVYAQESLVALVTFFNLTSPWHDRGLRDLIERLEQVNWRGQYSSMIEQLGHLHALFEKSGRSKHGWNRTKKGEEVTEENVYLGNTNGIWTFKIADFRKGGDAEVLAIVVSQAQSFLCEKTREIAEAIANINIEMVVRRIPF